eukprot:scaffold3428_cov379-Prasinococcus_capsulatus_cf.AAC.27
MTSGGSMASVALECRAGEEEEAASSWPLLLLMMLREPAHADEGVPQPAAGGPATSDSPLRAPFGPIFGPRGAVLGPLRASSGPARPDGCRGRWGGPGGVGEMVRVFARVWSGLILGDTPPLMDGHASTSDSGPPIRPGPPHRICWAPERPRALT